MLLVFLDFSIFSTNFTSISDLLVLPLSPSPVTKVLFCSWTRYVCTFKDTNRLVSVGSSSFCWFMRPPSLLLFQVCRLSGSTWRACYLFYTVQRRCKKRTQIFVGLMFRDVKGFCDSACNFRVSILFWKVSWNLRRIWAACWKNLWFLWATATCELLRFQWMWWVIEEDFLFLVQIVG